MTNEDAGAEMMRLAAARERLRWKEQQAAYAEWDDDPANAATPPTEAELAEMDEEEREYWEARLAEEDA